MVTKEAPTEIDCAIEKAVANLKGGLHLDRANKHGFYELEVFSEDSFLRNKEVLSEIVICSAQKDLGWKEATARRIYEKALRVENPEEESRIPSVLLYKKTGELAGVSAQRLIYVKTNEAGIIPVHYHILRAFREEHRGEGMGRDSVGDARLLHRKAKFYAARNGGPVPAWTTMQVSPEILDPETSHPWKRFYDEGEEDRVYQEIMVELHMAIRTDGKWINGTTGVSIADYPEYNRFYMPKPDHQPTNDLLSRMEGKKIKEGELGMNIKRGDSVIVVAKFKD